MTNIKIKSNVTSEFTLTINESEARALAAIISYGTDSFLEVFYKNLGSHYLQPHQDGVCSLFKTLRGLDRQLQVLNKVQKMAREEIKPPTHD